MIERKDSGAENAPPELKESVASLMTAFDAFKKKNDERLKEIEKKGTADALTEESLKKLEDAVKKSQDYYAEEHKKLEAAINRKGMNSTAESDAETKEAEDFSKQRGVTVSVDELKSYKSALMGYIRKNNSGNYDETKALSSGSDPDGGYTITPDLSGRIVKLIYETSPVRQVANVLTIGTNTLEGVFDLNDTSSGWVGDTEAPTETTTPKIGEWRIPVHTQYAEPRATQNMLDDASIDIEAWLAAKVADRISRTENTAFISGNGEKKPRGFLTYGAGTPSASAFNTLERIVSGASGAFAASAPGDALINLVFALKAFYRTNANFMMKRATLAEVRKLKDGQGNYLWQPDFATRQGGNLLGFGVVEAEDMPTMAANSLSIAFGDFNAGYQIVDRQGIRILRDALTAKPYVKFYTTKRTGGDVVNFEAIKLLKFATS